MKFLYFLNKNLIYIKLFLFIYNKIIKYFNNNLLNKKMKQ